MLDKEKDVNKKSKPNNKELKDKTKEEETSKKELKPFVESDGFFDLKDYQN